MKVIDLEEATANLKRYALECQSSPVVVTVEGKPSFELIPIRSDDIEFLDRLIDANPEFRNLLEARQQEKRAGKVISLEESRRRLQ